MRGTSETLCLYAQFVHRSFQSVQSIKNFISAVRTLHRILDIEFPTADMMHLNLLLRGISRTKQHIVKKAAPITPGILLDIYQFINFENSFDFAIWSLILTMFFSMARKSNMVPVSS